MDLVVSGFPAVIVFGAFVVIFALPVWVAARITRARNPTLLRSIASLVAGFVMTIASAALTGGFALLLSPICFFLSFKIFLGTSFLGAIVLGILALFGYALMVHVLGSGFDVPRSESGYV